MSAVAIGSHRRALRVGTLMGMGSAVGYSLANLGLRAAATNSDLGWAIWVSAVKCVPVTVAVWVLICWNASRGRTALPPRRALLALLVAGLTMQFGGNVLFQWAMSYAGLAITVPLMFACIIGSGAWLSRVFIGDPVTSRTLQAMAVLVTAIALLSVGVSSATDAAAGSTVKPAAAVALAIGASCVAGCAYGMTGVIIKRMVTSGVPAFASMMMFCTSGVVVLGSVGATRLGLARIAATPADVWGAMLFAGVCNALAFFALTGALKRIPVTRANILNASQVAMCAVGGVIVFSEPVTAPLVLGCLLTVTGILLVDNEVHSDDDS